MANRGVRLLCLMLVPLLCAGGAARSFDLPVRSQQEAFRMAVACSDLIVVCRVRVMNVIAGDHRQFGQLKVLRVLSGSARIGQGLTVPWSSQVSLEGHPVSSDPKLPLTSLIGSDVLVFLRGDDSLRLAAASPLPLTPDNVELLRTRVSWIRSPSSDDLLSGHLEDEWMEEGVPSPCDTARLEVVAAYLEGYLDGLDSGIEPPVEGGRSN